MMGKHHPGSEHLWTRLSHGFYETIDVGGNLRRALASAQGMTGMPATITGIACLLLALILAPWVWYLDISSTAEATSLALEVLIPALPSELVANSAVAVTFFPLLFALFPSLIELFGSRFGVDIRSIGWLVFVCAVFDMVTDAPRVMSLMEVYQPFFSDMLWGLGFALYYPMHLPVLFLSSFGLEMIFIVFAVVGVHLTARGISSK
jgi:hypothetical protein